MKIKILMAAAALTGALATPALAGDPYGPLADPDQRGPGAYRALRSGPVRHAGDV